MASTKPDGLALGTRIADEYPDIAKRLAEIKAEREAGLSKPEPAPTSPSAGVDVYVNWTPGNGEFG